MFPGSKVSFKQNYFYLSPTFFEFDNASGNDLKYNGKLERSVNPPLPQDCIVW
jgi:hypothetical protein